MGLLASLSVRLHRATLSNIPSQQMFLELIGIIRTLVSLESQIDGFGLISVSEVQYCDGVRGAIVVYDPEDPLKVLYDGE